MTDDRIAFEINRIRKELNESDMVTTFRVGKERRKMGLKKTQGGYGFLPKDSDKWGRLGNTLEEEMDLLSVNHP